MSLRSDLLCRNGCGFFGNPEWQWFCSKCWREHQMGKQGMAAGSSTSQQVHASEIPISSKISSHSHKHEQIQSSTGTNQELPKDTSTSKSFLSFASSIKSPNSSEKQPKEKSRSPRRSPIRLGSQLKSASFNKSDDKKKRFDQNLKQIFQKGKAGFSSKDSPDKTRLIDESQKKAGQASKANSSPSRSWSADFPPEAKLISSEFASFLNSRLERPAITEISRYVKGTTEKIIQITTQLSYSHTANQEQIERLSAMVQEFYQKLEKRLNSKPQLYHALTEEDVKKIMDFAEKYVMICCYRHLFCPTITNDEDKDLELQNRIRNLNWLSTSDLNCCINESSQDVRDLLYEAINDILEIDGKLAPQDKMECLTKCSKKIFDMLKVSNETPASADDFLPCLIYICLKANPPRIQSNINFITRFCNENKLRMGEAGYFFANLCCAMSFIENMTAESINMDPKTFDSYITGKSVPPGSWRTSLLMCDGLQVTSQNLKTLAELKKRQDLVLSQSLKLQEDMDAFQKDVEEEVKAVLDRTKYTIRHPKQPIKPDADVDESDVSALPPPLIPQNVQGESIEPVPITVSKLPDATATLDIPFSNSTTLMGPKVTVGEMQSDPRNISAFLEDYEDFMSLSSLTTADDISLLSVDISNPDASINLSGCVSDKKSPNEITVNVAEVQEETEDKKASHTPYIPAYRGLTAQIGSIPSISCDNSLPLIEDNPSNSNGYEIKAFIHFDLRMFSDGLS